MDRSLGSVGLTVVILGRNPAMLFFFFSLEGPPKVSIYKSFLGTLGFSRDDYSKLLPLLAKTGYSCSKAELGRFERYYPTVTFKPNVSSSPFLCIRCAKIWAVSDSVPPQNKPPVSGKGPSI